MKETCEGGMDNLPVYHRQLGQNRAQLSSPTRTWSRPRHLPFVVETEAGKQKSTVATLNWLGPCLVHNSEATLRDLESKVDGKSEIHYDILLNSSLNSQLSRPHHAHQLSASIPSRQTIPNGPFSASCASFSESCSMDPESKQFESISCKTSLIVFIQYIAELIACYIVTALLDSVE